VFGASFDTSEDNKVFRDTQGFTYPLLSDVDRVVGAQYHVIREPDHKYANFPERHSYLIDPAGIIVASYDVTDVAQHAADVLRTLREVSA
jgi:thioredoxin-dependent peroxiredoxin